MHNRPQQPMLKRPDGSNAHGLDNVMLLYAWAKHIREKKKLCSEKKTLKKFIVAGIGDPTSPMMTAFFENIGTRAREMVKRSTEARADLEMSKKLRDMKQEAGSQIAKKSAIDKGAVVGYGNIQGDLKARVPMATALTRLLNTKVAPDDIIFNVGGAGALHSIFQTVHALNPKGKLIIPSPFYGLYNESPNRIHPIDVLKSPGYRLTAASLQATIDGIIASGETISGFLLCNPNNPLGTALNKTELQAIAKVLKKYNFPVILDEAYTDMLFNGAETDGEKYSLLEDEELQNRIFYTSSATKSLSAAGERYAYTVCKNPELRSRLLKTNIKTTGHAPRSSQHAYAAAMAKLDEKELKNLTNFYGPQVNFVTEQLRAIDIAMPDASHKIQGGFYAIADLHELFGMKIPEGAKKALGPIGKASTDVHLAYSLLFDQHIMLAPLSALNADPKAGILRITCSRGVEELGELLRRVKLCVTKARLEKIASLLADIKSKASSLRKTPDSKAHLSTCDFSKLEVPAKLLNEYLQADNTKLGTAPCKEMKTIISDLEKLQGQLIIAKIKLQCGTTKKLNKTVFTLGSFFKAGLRRLQQQEAKKELMDSQWRKVVEDSTYFGNSEDMPLATKALQNMLFKYTAAQRLTYPAWKAHLDSLKTTDSKNPTPTIEIPLTPTQKSGATKRNTASL